MKLAERGRAILVPHPDQVVQMVYVDHAIVQLAEQLRRAELSRTAAPPEEVAVVLVHGPPQHRNVGILKLLQETSRRVHVLFPSLVKRGVGRDQFQPLLVGELGLHAAAPACSRLAGFILGRPQHVPAEVNDGPRRVLSLGLFDQQVPVRNGVLVLEVGETEVRTPDGGILAGDLVDCLEVRVAFIRKIVLAGQNPLARDIADLLQQVLSFLRRVGIYRHAGRRRRRSRGRPSRGLEPRNLLVLLIDDLP